MPFAPGRVPRGDHLLQKPQIFLAAGEVSVAAQEQSLVDGGFEVPVGRFGVAVLVWLANINPLARQAVVFQEPPIAALKLAFGRQVVDRRAQAVAAMPSRRSPEFPQRVL